MKERFGRIFGRLMDGCAVIPCLLIVLLFAGFVYLAVYSTWVRSGVWGILTNVGAGLLGGLAIVVIIMIAMTVGSLLGGLLGGKDAEEGGGAVAALLAVVVVFGYIFSNLR